MRIVLVFFVCLFAVSHAQENRCLRDPADNPHYLPRLEEIKAAIKEPVDIVMLGNSITAGGKWQELLLHDRVCNMGISSDNITGFIERAYLVIQANPSLCFIMGGINDLYDDCPVEDVFLRMQRLVTTLLDAKIQLVLQSTLYVSTRYPRWAAKNKQVMQFNRMLQALAAREHIPFLDVNTVLAPEGTLLSQYTSDGVHLTEKGYEVWAQQLGSFLRR